LIAYLDTSSLVKLYVEEQGRTAVVALVERADSIATSRITYAETRAALARLRRDRWLSAAALKDCVTQLDERWPGYRLVEVTEELVRRAGNLAERYALRGYDAVQLAAATELRIAGADLVFSSFDARLNTAVRRERIRVAQS
jgi:predicted nucleic acid-binding protein